MQRISKHISYQEAIKSNTASKLGIANSPNKEQLANMILLAENVFEPIREHFKVPIYISSFFRSEKLNNALKGAKNSQHLCNNGAAIDVDADIFGSITNKDIFDYVFNNLTFDQLIWEFGTETNPDWVHISYNADNNRGEVWVAYKDQNNRTKYKLYNT